MILEDALRYTHRALFRLASGGTVTVYRKSITCTVHVQRGAAGERQQHAASTAADVPVLLALHGIYCQPDRWEYGAQGDTDSPFAADFIAILDAIEAGQVPPFFGRLLDDTTPVGIGRVQECAAIIRAGAVAACMRTA